jgi:hypothetical protein
MVLSQTFPFPETTRDQKWINGAQVSCSQFFLEKYSVESFKKFGKKNLDVDNYEI